MGPRSRWGIVLVVPLGACSLITDLSDLRGTGDAASGDGGCGAVENCANGVDDDCNGLVDCQDPACQAYACNAAPPAGWAGPIAFAAVQGATVPVCVGAYATGPSGYGGLTASPATCGCSCPGPATGTQCGPVTLDAYGSINCTGTPTPTQLTVNVCNNNLLAPGSVKALAGAPTSLGTCAASPSKTVPLAVWANSYAVCEYTSQPSAGGCDAGALCVRTPESGYASKPCVYQDGDVACPGAPYTVKTLVAQGLADTRDCSACSCTPSGGSCGATVTAYTGGNCSSTAQPFSANGVCAAQGIGALSAEMTNPVVTPASCAPQGGVPVGSATPSNPITVCCQ